MIRCTPVCGPGPVRKWTSGVPEGWATVNATVAARRRGCRPRAGTRQVVDARRRDTGALGEPPPEAQPASAVAAARAARRGPRSRGRRPSAGENVGRVRRHEPARSRPRSRRAGAARAPRGRRPRACRRRRRAARPASGTRTAGARERLAPDREDVAEAQAAAGPERITPVGSVRADRIRQRPPRTAAPARRRGRATPTPGGTITTRPRANTSRWASAQRPAAAVAAQPADRLTAVGARPVGRSNRAPRPIGVTTGDVVGTGCVAPSSAATISRTATARAVIWEWVRAGAHVACHVSRVRTRPSGVGRPAKKRGTGTSGGARPRGAGSAARRAAPRHDGRRAAFACRERSGGGCDGIGERRAGRAQEALARDETAVATTASRTCTVTGAGGPRWAATAKTIRPACAAAWVTAGWRAGRRRRARRPPPAGPRAGRPVHARGAGMARTAAKRSAPTP